MPTTQYRIPLRRNKTTAKPCDTAVVLDGDIPNRIGATDRYIGHSYPAGDTTDTARISTFAIADVRMIRYLLFGRR